MKTRSLLVASLALVAVPALAPAGSVAQDPDVPALVAELKNLKDDAEPDKIRALANARTREAMEGLLEVYDAMGSVYMRRAVLQGLVLYDDVAGVEQQALQKIMNAATESSDRELREAAVDLLGDCSNYGKAFLKMVVESGADDDIRERAMRHHSGRPRTEDMEWYRSIYKPEKAAQAKAKRKAEQEGQPVPHPLQPLRLLAFEAIAGDLDASELLEGSKDKYSLLRIRALDELHSRQDKKALARAEEVFENSRERTRNRLAAADILADDVGPSISKRFFKQATKADVQEDFAIGLAERIGEFDDDDVRKEVVKNFGKDKGIKRLVYLYAGHKVDHPKIDKALLKLLKEKKDLRVQRLAMKWLGERRNDKALPELEKIVAKSKDAEAIVAALDAITMLRDGDAEWEAKLVEYAKGADADARNGALEVLGKTQNPDYLDLLMESCAHDLWSTRLAAARAIEHMAIERGVGAIATQMADETGRMSHELAEILWRMTGKPFRTKGRLWKKWWEDEGADFEIISASALRKLEQEEEARRLKQLTRTQFFGIRIISHRVTFILDISGSMNEMTRGKYVGEKGEPRIEVAKRELKKCLDALDSDSLFNIVTFENSVAAWQDHISEKTTESLADAQAYVDRFGANGGTNLYGALEFAFGDPDMDTIFLMSDGEPTVGDVLDPLAIRHAVGEWNEHRGVVIHSIAVGGSLQALEWLAADTGGTYVKFP